MIIAEIVEKYFTINNNLSGRDNKFAILPNELKFICEFRSKVLEMKKSHGLGLQKIETDVYKFYRGRFRKYHKVSN